MVLDDFTAPFQGLGDAVVTGFLIAFVIILCLLPIIIAVWIMSYNISVTVRHLKGGKIVIGHDKGKVVKDRKGVEKIKLLKTPKMFRSERIAIPPDEVIYPTSKGKDHFDVYRTKNGQYYFTKDNGTDNGIKIPEDGVTEDFEAMNTMDRDFYATEWEEAEKYKKKSWMEVANAIAPWFIIFLMFTVLIVNWDSIAKPALESQQESLKMQKENTKLVMEIQKTAAIMSGVQIPADAEVKENDPGK